MEFHPIANEWPLLEGEEFARLVESVSKHGVKVACWRFEGKILDGRNRYRAAEESGIPILNWHTFEGAEEDARELAKLLNDQRRHMTREDRAAWVRKLHTNGMSNRAIADAVKVDEKTVRKDLKRISGADKSAPEPTTKGTDDGREETASVPDCLSGGDVREAQAGSGFFRSGEHPLETATDRAGEEPKRTSAGGSVSRVTGRDGKQYPATKPKPASKPVKSNALELAQNAINALMGVRQDDPKHNQAIEKVLRWCEYRLNNRG